MLVFILWFLVRWIMTILWNRTIGVDGRVNDLANVKVRVMILIKLNPPVQILHTLTLDTTRPLTVL